LDEGCLGDEVIRVGEVDADVVPMTLVASVGVAAVAVAVGPTAASVPTSRAASTGAKRS